MVCTEKLYIESAESLLEKLNRYDQIIEALELEMLNSGAANAGIEEYTLDDGQVKIKMIYRDAMAIASAIDKFTYLRNKCYNSLNGHGFVLRPAR